MEVRPGYKHTEVGVLPKDWGCERLSALTDPKRPISYGVVQTGPNVLNGVRCLRVVDIEDGRINKTNLITTTKKISDAYKRTILTAGDLVVPLRGKVGDVAMVDEELAGCNLTRGVALIAIRPDSSAPFYRQVISSSATRGRLEQSMNGSALQEIPIAILRSFKVALPPTKAEQDAIADTLGDVDVLIESLEQLIVKKRHLKQGAMQELLTGKTRLPGFNGEWKTRQLGEVIAGCSSGATPYRGRPEYYKGAVKWITSGELNYNWIEDTLEHVSDEAVEKTNLKMHPVGTLLIAITGLEAAGTRGACGIVGSPATTNQSCMAIYPSAELRTEYLYHYYVLRGNELALRYCQGTKQQSYTATLIRLLPIALPPSVDEQNAIAATLTNMDAEIAALEARLAKTCALKQAMMQELLTGKTRLFSPEASYA
jgi:type I restriction enzyme S subunit